MLKDLDRETALDPKEKGVIFLRTLLEKALRDILLAEARPAPRVILLPNELIEDEIKDALLYIASTTPGDNMITIRVIKAAWVDLKDPIVILYRASIRLGYYSKAFKGS